MSQLIPLTQGKFAIVDDEDVARISNIKWHAHRERRGTFRAVNRVNFGSDQRRLVGIERIILQVPTRILIDHINHNPLDNRKDNLRWATYQQNSFNTRKGYVSTTSKFKGVNFAPHAKKWRAYIIAGRKRKHLGYFTNEQAAANAYDEAAKVNFGEFAFLNLAGKEEKL